MVAVYIIIYTRVYTRKKLVLLVDILNRKKARKGRSTPFPHHSKKNFTIIFPVCQPFERAFLQTFSKFMQKMNIFLIKRPIVAIFKKTAHF